MVNDLHGKLDRKSLHVPSWWDEQWKPHGMKTLLAWGSAPKHWFPPWGTVPCSQRADPWEAWRVRLHWGAPPPINFCLDSLCAKPPDQTPVGEAFEGTAEGLGPGRIHLEALLGTCEASSALTA